MLILVTAFILFITPRGLLGQIIYSNRPPNSTTACFQLPTKAVGTKFLLFKSFIPDCDCCWYEYRPQSTNSTYGVAEFHNGLENNFNAISMQEVNDGIYVRANVDYPDETDLVRMLDFDYNSDNGYTCTYTCHRDGITVEDLMCHGASIRSKQRIENVLMSYAFIFPKKSILYNSMMCEKPQFGNELFNPIYYRVNASSGQLGYD